MVKRNPYREKIPRKKPTSDEKVGACLIAMGLVDRQWAKNKTPEEICSLVDWDHDPVPHALGGTNHPTNLLPRLRPDHQQKTAKTDTPAVAKHDRLLPQQIEFRRKMLAKVGQSEPGPEHPKKRKKQWPKGRKIQSQGFPKRSKAPRQGL